MSQPLLPPAVLCVGETMAMVVPRDARPLRSAEDFVIGVGGAESTVAMYLADFGCRAAWFSALGDDPLGERILDVVSARGVDVGSVVRDGHHPTGLYLKDPRADGTTVHYYRDGSAASALDAGAATVLELDGYALVHTTGITAAISQSSRRLVTELWRRAADADIRRSFDVNYRPALWPADVAGPVLLTLAREADVVFVGRDEAAALWGTHDARDIAALLDGAGCIVVKDSHVGATHHEAGETVFEPALEVDVIEHVGAGDAFAAGYLAGYLAGESPAARLRLGHRTAAHTLASVVDYVPLEPGSALWPSAVVLQ